MMEDEAAPAAEMRTVYWAPPEDGVRAALTSNPFLSGGRVRSAVTRRASTIGGGHGLALAGIRTGNSKAAIINNRVVREGEDIAGWRVVSVATGRVTLRNTDGKTIRLAAK